jgi:hypothetical protein
MFQQRLDMETVYPGSGIVLKLILNTLYGKMAQQRPVQGPFYNVVYASLITSLVRSRVYGVYLSGAPVIMFATDAVFTLAPTDLPTGGLGGWELAHGGEPYRDMTIFQPGVYFDGDSAAFKTRGVPKAVFRNNAQALKANSLNFGSTFPVALDTHLSMRLALARGTEDALANIGNWRTVTKEMSSDPTRKRIPTLTYDDAGTAWSRPIREYAVTVPYTPKQSAQANDRYRLDDDLISDGYYEGEF